MDHRVTNTATMLPKARMIIKTSATMLRSQDTSDDAYNNQQHIMPPSKPLTKSVPCETSQVERSWLKDEAIANISLFERGRSQCWSRIVPEHESSGCDNIVKKNKRMIV
jgi:hypothetical protein